MHRIILRSTALSALISRSQLQLSSSMWSLLSLHHRQTRRWSSLLLGRRSPPIQCDRSSVHPLSSMLFTLQNFSSSSASSTSSLSPFDAKNMKAIDKSNNDSENSNISTSSKKRRRTFIPRIAAVQLTEKARAFFKKLLDHPIRPDIVGIMLNYDQSKSGEPRMVYTFQFVTNNDIDPEQDEGVSLEMIPSSKVDPTTGEPILIPKSPVDSRNDGLPKLYIHHHAFLKVLGATIDVDTETIAPILYDREGNRMDPNA